ncbi:MAG: ABC transporter substrate-binding protein [Candidatus Adiutrix sp.]|nr:ABC transporter substrate-binding protein [Candidatus Adiutrix sp.]
MFLLIITAAAAQAAETRTVTDMRGRIVTFPAELQKVAAVDDGLVEEVMASFGLIGRLAAVSSRYMTIDVDFVFETVSGKKIARHGFDALRFMHPRLAELPSFQGLEGGPPNLEILAQVQPDLVILRAGDCAVNRDETHLAKTIEAIEAAGWPLVVLNAPGVCGADITAIRDEIVLLGEVFDRRNEAEELAGYLAGIENDARTRVSLIPDDQKVSMLYMGLASFLRRMSATASAMGSDAPISYLMETLVNAKNAYPGHGFGVHLSTEQLYALDPDVIVLSPLGGYHPPQELYEAPDFADLSELKAIKNRRVYAMPWTPGFCAPRLEYPLDILVMAKAAYPDRFSDFNVYDFALDFYQKIYKVDANTAKGLRSTQMLDWMADEKF